MAAQPWMKFYPGDWLGDRRLSRCSLAAQGLWLRLLCLMFRAEERGRLPPDLAPEDLAALASCDPAELGPLLSELRAAGVAELDPEGALASPRMLREARKAGKCAAAGRKGGGSPRLRPDAPTFKGQGATFKGQGSTFKGRAAETGFDVPQESTQPEEPEGDTDMDTLEGFDVPMTFKGQASTFKGRADAGGGSIPQVVAVPSVASNGTIEGYDGRVTFKGHGSTFKGHGRQEGGSNGQGHGAEGFAANGPVGVPGAAAGCAPPVSPSPLPPFPPPTPPSISPLPSTPLPSRSETLGRGDDGGEPVKRQQPNTSGTAELFPDHVPASGHDPGKGGRPFDPAHPLFARFWAAYPKRVAKRDALKAWARLGVTTGLLDEMLAAIERQRRTQWANGFVPNPATWLNGRRWEDEDVPSPGPAPKPSVAEVIRAARARVEARKRGEVP